MYVLSGSPSGAAPALHPISSKLPAQAITSSPTTAKTAPGLTDYTQAVTEQVSPLESSSAQYWG